MKQSTNLSRLPKSLWSELLGSNPQLFRELQGKLKTKNVLVAAACSAIAQFIATIYLLGRLPDLSSATLELGRYGVATMADERSVMQTYHLKDEFGHWLVNWQLWWQDLFVILSLIGIAALLVLGTYMLIADVVREEERGTLNFIRLTPQSAGSILMGKIVGVPILLYIAIALCSPLHLVASWQSHIPLSLTLSFYAVAIAACGFFYCSALLWGLLDLGISSLKPWLASGSLAIFLLFSSALIVYGHSELDRFFVWTLLFHPGTVIAYLVDASNLNFGEACCLSPKELGNFTFFGRALWANATVGIGSILLNFALWTYWCWTILKRRFHNPESTILNKAQSYWLTACFSIATLGFAIQNNIYSTDFSSTDDLQHLADNFWQFQLCLSVFCLGLVFALTPQRQTLHDWARYRHQVTPTNSLSNELIFGENSPAIVAIAINLAISIGFVTPSIRLILEPSQKYLFWSLIIGAVNILLCAAIAQLILTSKTSKKGIWSFVTVAAAIVLPALCLSISGTSIDTAPNLWLFSFVGASATEYASVSAIAFAIFAQLLAVSVISLQITRRLKQAGASETKVLMSRAKALQDSEQQ